MSGGSVLEAGASESREHSPMTTLFALERTIQQRREAMEGDSGGAFSWVPQARAGSRCGGQGWGCTRDVPQCGGLDITAWKGVLNTALSTVRSW